jgi:hypothetical protein
MAWAWLMPGKRAEPVPKISPMAPTPTKPRRSPPRNPPPRGNLTFRSLRRRAHWTSGDAWQSGDGTGVGGRGAPLPASDECADRRGPFYLGTDGGEPRGGSAAQVRGAGPAQLGPDCRRGRGHACSWGAAGAGDSVPRSGGRARGAIGDPGRASTCHRGGTGRGRQDPAGDQCRRRPGRGAAGRDVVRRSRSGGGSRRGRRGRGRGGGGTRAAGGLPGGGTCGLAGPA